MRLVIGLRFQKKSICSVRRIKLKNYKFRKENITKLREEKGLSQKELAVASGVTPASISRWENGERIPNAVYIAQLANALDVKISYFFK